jgi:ketosteroid isomerase-like protein
MSKDPLDHVRALVEEVWNTGELLRSDQYFTSVFLFNGLGANANDALQYQARLRQLFDDLHFNIEDLFCSADGEKVTLRWLATGRHKQDGRTAAWYGTHVFYFVDGQISQVWSQGHPPE